MLWRFNEVLIGFEAAALFYLAAGFFFVEAAELGAAGGFGGAAFFGGMQDGEDHFFELIEARLDVLGLVAVFFAVDDDFAACRDAAGVSRLEALADGGRQAGAVRHVEMQDGLAGDLVDVLSAGAAAAGEREAQLGVGDGDRGANLEVHGGIVSCQLSVVGTGGEGLTSAGSWLSGKLEVVLEKGVREFGNFEKRSTGARVEGLRRGS